MTQPYVTRYRQLQQIHTNNVFSIYTQLASELELAYDIAFFNGNVNLPNLTPQVAHESSISPFRIRIAEIYADLLPNEDMQSELQDFTDMLVKARMIVTTNYDEFIEKQLNHAIKIRVGNRGLFEPAGELNLLYKIHGSIKFPDTIMITQDDYQKMDRTSAIVNAKILSQLTESPILFMGYSLTDKNIQSLLRDLADNAPFSIQEAANRIGVVEYSPGLETVAEVIKDADFGMHYTKISTDNFRRVYSSVAKIDQGFSPLEISKYQRAFRQIIDVKGQHGELKQVLTTFLNLERLPEALKHRNLVVAFGDSQYLFKMPDYVDYVKAYFLRDKPMEHDVALRFITQMAPNSPLPVAKYLNTDQPISDAMKSKLNARLARFGSLATLQDTIHIPLATEQQLGVHSEYSAVELLDCDDGIKASIKLAYFAKHIKSIDALELIHHLLNKTSASFIKQTNARKLFMAYSLLTEPIPNRLK